MSMVETIGNILGVGNYRGDPDYVVTLDGSPIPSTDIIQWAIVDDEESASSIVVQLENHDYRHSGKIKIGALLCVRFGYVGFLVGKAEFPVMAYKESYGLKGCIVAITGKDPTQKGGGNKHSGKQKSNSPKEALQAIGDARLQKGKVDVQGNFPEHIKNERNKPAPILWMNESMEEMKEKLLAFGADEKQIDQNLRASQDTFPDESGQPKGFEGEATNGDSQSGLGHESDKNRGNNAGGKGGQDPVTATISLIGYPELKAKKTVTIENAGPNASGIYYVKQCRHQVARGGGDYRTSASLIRGGSGKGGAGPTNGYSPVVDFANIYGSGGYIGPRKYDSPVQGVIVVGRGGPVIDFEMTVSPQHNRGGGKDRGKTKGHDLTDKAKPIDDNRLKKSKGSTSNEQGQGATP